MKRLFYLVLVTSFFLIAVTLAVADGTNRGHVKVTFCHITHHWEGPDGEYVDAGHLITVDMAAFQAHLNHGDLPPGEEELIDNSNRDIINSMIEQIGGHPSFLPKGINCGDFSTYEEPPPT